jgi:hypothetical protein
MHAWHAGSPASAEEGSIVSGNDRRRVMQLSLATMAALIASSRTADAATDELSQLGAGARHDFDWFFGSWNVKHRRLNRRLVNSNEWEEFEGSTRCQPILGGIANFNDGIVKRSGSTHYGMGLRAFDSKANIWRDWYLDGRDPTKIEVHGAGRFANGVGTFSYDDTFEGRAIKVRGIFTSIKADLAQWEQAFSPDGGKTWETNYVMRYMRIA